MKKSRKKISRRAKRKFEPKVPISVVTRDGKTTTRQLAGCRFVRFGEVRGKRVAWVQFYTCGSENHSISIRFQDRTVLYFTITPLFAIKPRYYNARPDELEIIKEWPEMKIER